MNKKLLSRTITFAFLGLFIWYGFANSESLKGLAEVSIFALLLVAAGKLAMHTVTAFFTKWMAEVFTGNLTIGEALYIGIYAAIGNFFGPLLGGAGVRAVYLKKKYKLPYAKFTAMMLGYYLIIFTFNFAVAIWAVLALSDSGQRGILLFGFVFALAALVSMYFIRLPNQSRSSIAKISKHKIGAKFVEIIYGIEDGVHMIIKTKGLFLKLILLAVLNFAAILFLAAVQFSAIGADISFTALCLYVVFVNISLVLSFTPGAIGIREALMIVISSTLAVTTSDILQVAVIDRGVNFAVLLVLFLIARNKRVKAALVGAEDLQD